MNLSDSSRRFILFLVIVIGGSVLLIFDIPVVYLMVALFGLAGILLVVTGAIIIGDVIHEIRYVLKNRKPKVKKIKPKKEPKQKKEPKKREAAGKSSPFSLLSGKGGSDTQKTKKEKSSLFSSLSRDSAEKDVTQRDTKRPGKADTPQPGSEEKDKSESTTGQTVIRKKEEDIDADLLDDFDIDLDLDSELDSMNPDDEFKSIRTPFAEDSAMPEASDVQKLDIATSEEDDEIIFDENAVGDDDIDSIYSSAMDTGSASGSDDILASMEGGDSISMSDISSYSSGDDSPYGYGGDEESEEQYELGAFGSGGGDDDLIASLKADINELKEKDDNCLLRDLKDIDVSAEQLQDELQDIMNIITKKIKKR